MQGWKTLGIAVLALGGLVSAPSFANKACDDYAKIKQMEREAVDTAKGNEDDRDKRTQEMNTLNTRSKNVERQQEELDKADKEQKEAQKEVDELGPKVAELETKVQQAQAKADAANSKSTAQDPSNAAAVARRELTEAQDALKPVKEAHQKALERLKKANQEVTKWKGEVSKATRERDEQAEKVKKQDTATGKSSNQRTVKLNEFLNKYRDLAVSAQRCDMYKPSELGIALTKTRWKTAQNILGRVLKQNSDQQRALFGGDRAFSGGTNRVGDGVQEGSTSQLLGSFGNGSNLPATLQNNLKRRIGEADAAYNKRMKDLERTWLAKGAVR